MGLTVGPAGVLFETGPGGGVPVLFFRRADFAQGRDLPLHRASASNRACHEEGAEEGRDSVRGSRCGADGVHSREWSRRTRREAPAARELRVVMGGRRPRREHLRGPPASSARIGRAIGLGRPAVLQQSGRRQCRRHRATAVRLPSRWKWSMERTRQRRVVGTRPELRRGVGARERRGSDCEPAASRNGLRAESDAVAPAPGPRGQRPGISRGGSSVIVIRAL